MKRKRKPRVDKNGVPIWKGSFEVERIRYENMALRHVRIPCNKPNCGRCPHGPYWYLVTWRGMRRTQWYIGRRLLGARLRKFPDKEHLVCWVILKAGYMPAAEEVEYVPRELEGHLSGLGLGGEAS